MNAIEMAECGLWIADLKPANPQFAIRNPQCARARAFTLVELIIVSALLMVLGGGLLTAFLTGQASYLSADAYVQVQQEARKAFDNVVRELREAGPPGPTAGFPKTTVANPPSCPTCNQLNFQVAIGYNSPLANCPASAICWGDTAANEWIHYAAVTLPGTNILQLVRCVTANKGDVISAGTACLARRVLANNVSSVSFSLDNPADPDMVTIALRIQYTNPRLPGGSQAIGQLTSRVRLRNS